METYKIENFPGFNVARTLVFLIYLILFLAYFSLLNFPDSIDALYLRYTHLVFFISIFFCIFSAIIAWKAMTIESNAIKAHKLYLPKLFIDSAMFLFFLTICFWIFYLGGILNSPFSGLLTISPLFLIVQIISRKELVRNVELLLNMSPQSSGRSRLESSLSVLKKHFGIVIVLNSLASLIIITLTIAFLEHIVFSSSGRISVLFKTIVMDDPEIRNTWWFMFTSYFIFYISILSVMLAIIPPRIFSRISQKFFF